MSSSRYILPYCEDCLNRPYRKKLHNDTLFLVWSDDFVSPDRRLLWRNHYCTTWFNTKGEAMADLDKRLIEDGYILLTEEQVLLI